MRKNGTLYYMFSDHLGSTSITTDSAGNVISEMRYKPWGETRYAGGNTPTQYTFTGQRDYTSDFGLMYFNARWVDVSTGRFAQADTVIPQGQGVQAWDRYAFVNNNPVRYTDPNGHCIELTTFIACVAGFVIIVLIVDAIYHGEQNQGDVPIPKNPLPISPIPGLVTITPSPTLSDFFMGLQPPPLLPFPTPCAPPANCYTPPTSTPLTFGPPPKPTETSQPESTSTNSTSASSTSTSGLMQTPTFTNLPSDIPLVVLQWLADH